MSLMAANRRQVMNAPSHKGAIRWLIACIILTVLAIIVYSGAAWNWFSPVLHKPMINRYAAQYKFDPLWVMSLIRVESRFAPNAESHKGALGLMQLMPTTARQLAPEVGVTDFKDDDLKNPDINLRIGCYYLSKLSAMFPEDETALLSAYNAGPGITQQWRGGKPALDLGDIEYPETRNFVKGVTRTYAMLKSMQQWKRYVGIDNDN